MKNTLEIRPEDHFLKMHSSYVANIHRIENVRKNEIELSGFTMPISKANREALMPNLKVL